MIIPVVLTADALVTSSDRIVAQQRLEQLMRQTAQAAINAAVEALEAFLGPENGLPRPRVAGVARSAAGIVVALAPLAIDREDDAPGPLQITNGKVCPGCHTWLALGHFYRQQSSRDGRSSRCKPCFAESKGR